MWETRKIAQVEQFVSAYYVNVVELLWDRNAFRCTHTKTINKWPVTGMESFELFPNITWYTHMQCTEHTARRDKCRFFSVRNTGTEIEDSAARNIYMQLDLCGIYSLFFYIVLLFTARVAVWLCVFEKVCAQLCTLPPHCAMIIVGTTDKEPSKAYNLWHIFIGIFVDFLVFFFQLSFFFHVHDTFCNNRVLHSLSSQKY